MRRLFWLINYVFVHFEQVTLEAFESFEINEKDYCI